jgi:hypothetical protein
MDTLQNTESRKLTGEGKVVAREPGGSFAGIKIDQERQLHVFVGTGKRQKQVMGHLGDDLPTALRKAADTIERLRDDFAVDGLIEVIHDQNPAIRACEQLAELADGGVLVAFITETGDRLIHRVSVDDGAVTIEPHDGQIE